LATLNDLKNMMIYKWNSASTTFPVGWGTIYQDFANHLEVAQPTGVFSPQRKCSSNPRKMDATSVYAMISQGINKFSGSIAAS